LHRSTAALLPSEIYTSSRAVAAGERQAVGRRGEKAKGPAGSISGVTARGKLLGQILSGRSDANIGFESLRSLLRSLGFEERIRGDHHIFTAHGIAEILNLQPLSSGKAKPYQVKQVRNVIVRYKLVEEPDA
jgi:hypothetical protein